MLTRDMRRLLGVPVLALAIAGAAFGVQKARVVLGVQPDGSVIVPTNQTLTPVGIVRRLELTRPKDLALSPDGKMVAVRAQRNLFVFASDGTQLATVNCAAGPLGIAWAPDGSAFYASKDDGSVARVSVGSLPDLPMTDIPVEKLVAAREPGVHVKDAQTTGLAVSPDGKRLYAGLGIRNAVAVVDLPAGTLVQVVPVGVCPYRIALSPDGKTLYVANRGGRRVPAGPGTEPSAGTPVRVDRRTDAALRGSVTIVDTATFKTDEVDVGRQPAGLAVTPDGRTVYVANSDDDTVSVLDAKSRRVVRTIGLRPKEDPGFGQMPSADVVSGDGTRLYVTCGGANAVAVVSLAGKPKVLGFIPTGWFPIAVVERGGWLYVVSSKGIGARPDRPVPRFGVHDSVGTVQFISAAAIADLASLTHEVAENNHWGAEQPARSGVAAVPVPERVGEPSVFKHVVYIIRENHTYDLNFGDIKEGNGDPSLCVFGEKVTPNQHALARDFVLLDNTYTSGTNSADGHQWCDSAICNDYMEHNYSASARSYPYDGGDPLAYSPAGFLWTDAARHHLSVRVYGEFVNRPKIVDTESPGAGNVGQGGSGMNQGKVAASPRQSVTWSALWHDYKTGGHRFQITPETDSAALRPFLHPHYIGFPQVVSDQWRASQYLADLAGFEKNDDMPALSIMLLPDDHTSGLRKGMPTPRAAVADNDLALGRIVEGISHSRFWKDTLIMVIEDDSQFGIDHVDGHRTVALCISPYTRRGVVVSQMYNHTSLIRTMELVLGMPAMDRFDRTATPMTACFQSTPDMHPYTAIPNKIPLDELNPAPSALHGQARRVAIASAKQDWSQVDRADPVVVAKAAWLSCKPGVPFPWSHFHPDGD